MCVINETISACVLTDLSPASSPDQSSTVLAASDAALVDTSGHDHDYISTYSILSSSAVACMPAGTSDNELVLPSVNANTSMSRPASRQESLTSDVLPVAQLQDSDSLSVTPGSSRKRYHAADISPYPKCDRSDKWQKRSQKAEILTSSPFKKALERKEMTKKQVKPRENRKKSNGQEKGIKKAERKAASST